MPSFASRERSRRDFLSWLGAGAATAAVGCAVPTSKAEATESALDSRPEANGDVCVATSSDALGPYWEPGAPVRVTRIADPNERGVKLAVEGKVLAPDCLTPLADYTLDVWQADADGNYYQGTDTNYRLRGKIKTDALGRYRFESVLPGRYGDSSGIRPAHIHVSFLSPGDNVILTTQLYFAGDPYLGDRDYCTREHTCNSGDPGRALTLLDGSVSNVPGKIASFTAVLPTT
jgi:protocatechuate 3,4-dioxygenase beta subunit